MLEKKNSELIAQIEILKAENQALNMKLADTKADSQKIQSLQEELKRKSTLINSLQALVKVIEASNITGERFKSQDFEAEGESGDQKYNQLLVQYSNLYCFGVKLTRNMCYIGNLKEDWIRIKNECDTLKAAVGGLQEKDEKFLERIAQSNSDLKEQNKKLAADAKRIYEDALEKIGAFKKFARDLLGWEISITQEIVELRNTQPWTAGKESTVVVRTNEEGTTQEIIETEFLKEMFNKNQSLVQIAQRSYPVLFSYLNMLLRPDVSGL